MKLRRNTWTVVVLLALFLLVSACQEPPEIEFDAFSQPVANGLVSLRFELGDALFDQVRVRGQSANTTFETVFPISGAVAVSEFRLGNGTWFLAISVENFDGEIFWCGFAELEVVPGEVTGVSPIMSPAVTCEPWESSCSDGDDNDLDGAADCDDLDCFGRWCDDGLVCTLGETCTTTGCAGGVQDDCDDGDLCTQDSAVCNTSTGCSHTPLTCNDGDPCTSNLCDPVTGCSNPRDTCDDGDLCTADACAAGTGACSYTAVTCDDSDVCTLDVCDAIQGCRHAPLNCGPLEVCTASGCAPMPCTLASECDDGEVCTGDVCNVSGFCENTVLPDTTVCGSSADPCETLTCQSGACTSTILSCDDGDACTLGDGCDGAGGCLATASKNCDDSDVCTTDSCIGAGQCVNDVIPGCSDCGVILGGCPLGFVCTGNTCLSSNDTLYIPTGTFTMGCDPANPADPICEFLADAQPLHSVTLDAFEMDRVEVSVGEYQACIDAAVCGGPFCGGLDTQPAHCVGWTNAASFCGWNGGRLCTEAEWEYAAVGTDGRLRPWGNDVRGCPDTWFQDDTGVTGTGCGTNQTNQVGASAGDVSFFGVRDMAGNVSEWTADWYDASYYASSPLLDPTGAASGDRHVMRGGSYLWGAPDIFYPNIYERGYGTSTPYDGPADGVGLRCCYDLPPCLGAADGTFCDDGDPCTVSECQSEVCTPSPKCDDSDPCTTDSCNAGACTNLSKANGEACDDGDPCWSGDTCAWGTCIPGSTPLSCTDGNGCTVDTCLHGVGCQNDVCPAGYACEASTCRDTGEDLVHVPAGGFWMGCSPAAEFGPCFLWSDAFPHLVSLPAFDIAAKEATVQELIDCQLGGGCPGVSFCAPSFPISSYPNHPAGCLNYAGAESYCQWKGQRLCTEAEWEKASRSGDRRQYPWGQAPPNCSLSSVNETGLAGGSGCGAGTSELPGSHPLGVSPYGVYDLSGSMSEWVADWYDPSYYDSSPLLDPPGPTTGTLRVARGSLFSTPLSPNAQFQYSWYRQSINPVTGPFSNGRYGVRCCRDAL